MLEFTHFCSLHAEGFAHTHYQHSHYKNNLECLWTEYGNLRIFLFVNGIGLVQNKVTIGSIMIETLKTTIYVAPCCTRTVVLCCTESGKKVNQLCYLSLFSIINWF